MRRMRKTAPRSDEGREQLLLRRERASRLCGACKVDAGRAGDGDKDEGAVQEGQGRRAHRRAEYRAQRTRTHNCCRVQATRAEGRREEER